MEDKKVKITHEVPIFPLPNMVFFPKTILPLHIFEQRYRLMVQDALSGENLIGLVLLKSGWEKDYFGAPEVHEIACIGKIQQTEKLHGGKYNITLYGLSRIKIIKFVQDTPYRVAEVKYLKDITFDHDHFNVDYETRAFLALIRKYLHELGIEHLDELLKLQGNSLEATVNQIASILDFGVSEKQELLEMANLESRYERVRKMIHDRLFSLKIAQKIKIVPKDPNLN